MAVTEATVLAVDVEFASNYAASGSTANLDPVTVPAGDMLVLLGGTQSSQITGLVFGDTGAHTWTTLLAYAPSFGVLLSFWINTTGSSVTITPTVTPTWTANKPMAVSGYVISGSDGSPRIAATITNTSTAQASAAPSATGSLFCLHYALSSPTADVSSFVAGTTRDTSPAGTGVGLTGGNEFGTGTMYQTAVNSQTASPVTVGANAPTTAGAYGVLVEYKPAGGGGGSDAPVVIGSAAGFASATLPTPAGTLAGDLVIFHGYVRGAQVGTGAPKGPPGFQLVDGWPITGTGADADHTVTHYCWASYTTQGGLFTLAWNPAGFPAFAAQLIVVRGGPVAGVPFKEQDPEVAVPDGSTSFPACTITTADDNDLLLYLASDANDGDITTGVTMSDGGHTWTSLTWHSIGAFATTQATAGTTGSVHGVGVATGSYAKTAALVSVSKVSAGSGIFAAVGGEWVPVNVYFALNGAWV